MENKSKSKKLLLFVVIVVVNITLSLIVTCIIPSRSVLSNMLVDDKMEMALYKRCTVEVEAEITKCREQEVTMDGISSEGPVSTTVIMNFADLKYTYNGEEYIGREHVSPSSKVGDKLTIKVNPDNPKELYIGEPVGLFGSGVLTFVVVFIIFIVISTVLFFIVLGISALTGGNVEISNGCDD